jgi:hypothetical protein
MFAISAYIGAGNHCIYIEEWQRIPCNPTKTEKRLTFVRSSDITGHSAHLQTEHIISGHAIPLPAFKVLGISAGIPSKISSNIIFVINFTG